MQADLSMRKVSESALSNCVFAESTGILFHNVFEVLLTEH